MRVILIFLLLTIYLFPFAGLAEDEKELMEPVIIDTVTAIGGEAGELEINLSARYDFDTRLFMVPLEVEYAIWDGFGVELELPFISTRENAGLGDMEMAFQWTCLQRDFSGGRWLSALGLEIGIPIGSEDRGLSEGSWELEPFIFFPFEFDRLLIQPKLGLGIPLSGEEESEEEEIEFLYSLAVLYRVNESLIAGVEFIGQSGEQTVLSIAPEFIVGIGENIFIGVAGEIMFKPDNMFSLFVRVALELE